MFTLKHINSKQFEPNDINLIIGRIMMVKTAGKMKGN